MEAYLLDAPHLTKYYPLEAGPWRRLLSRQPPRVVQAVDGVSFTLAPSETLGLVGESGCGKTTTGRLVLRAIDPTAGRLLFNGQDITTLQGQALQPFRRQVQIVFQDPYASLNPRLPIQQIVGEPMLVHGLASKNTLRDEVYKVLEMVGLSPEYAGRWNSPEFDRLVELAQVEADQKKRQQYYADAVKVLIEEAPSAVILHENEQKVFAKYVKGFQPIPVNAINTHGVWLDKA